MLQMADLPLLEDHGFGANRHRQPQPNSTFQMVREPCDCVAAVPRLPDPVTAARSMYASRCV